MSGPRKRRCRRATGTAGEGAGKGAPPAGGGAWGAYGVSVKLTPVALARVRSTAGVDLAP